MSVMYLSIPVRLDECALEEAIIETIMELTLDTMCFNDIPNASDEIRDKIYNAYVDKAFRILEDL